MVNQKVIRSIKSNWELYWILFFIALMILLLNPRLQAWWHLRQVKNEFAGEMDPVLTQKWAVAILGQYHWDKESLSYPSWSRTNLPPGASGMVQKYGYRPTVQVQGDHVVLFAEVRGAHPMLFVGPTNFYCEGDHTLMWRPGVYIVIPEVTE
jgi:hypothetical protein